MKPHRPLQLAWRTAEHGVGACIHACVHAGTAPASGSGSSNASAGNWNTDSRMARWDCAKATDARALRWRPSRKGSRGVRRSMSSKVWWMTALQWH